MLRLKRHKEEGKRKQVLITLFGALSFIKINFSFAFLFMDNKNHETVIEMLLTSAKMKSKNEKKDGAV
jgi:hypothetical protein